MLKEDVLRKLGSEIQQMRAVMYRRLVQLHERKTKKDPLLQQILSLSPKNRAAIETIIASLGAR